MFSALRKHISPTTVVAFLALVFAMTGGAFAASSGSGGGSSPGARASASVTPTATAAKSKAKPKTKAGPRGPAGPAGKNGATGATGPVGAAGSQGPAGAAGAKGETGAPGAAGVAGAAGATGPTGPEGSFNTTLPKGKTLKGDWSITQTLPGTGLIGGATSTAVSFGIPLEAAPTVIYIKENEATPSGCTGNAEDPGAEPGNLCVFTGSEDNISQVSVCPTSESVNAWVNCVSGGGRKADPSGFAVALFDAQAGLVTLNGTWAVTAE
jgi:Collagen triple helix repeat (20 copies)